VSSDIAEACSVGQVMAQAVTVTGGFNNAKIISYLHSGVTLTSVQGPVKFDSLGENGASAAFISQWQDGGTAFNQVLPAGQPGSVAIIATKPAWTNISRVAAITYGIGVAVTAAGGMVYGATSAFTPNNGYDLISRLLAIIVLGGLGSIGGALVASIFMITLESVVDIWQPTWAIVVFYAALVLVLLIRPAGFSGRKAVRAQ
jgi:hypothetical protein